MHKKKTVLFLGYASDENRLFKSQCEMTLTFIGSAQQADLNLRLYQVKVPDSCLHVMKGLCARHILCENSVHKVDHALLDLILDIRIIVDLVAIARIQLCLYIVACGD